MPKYIVFFMELIRWSSVCAWISIGVPGGSGATRPLPRDGGVEEARMRDSQGGGESDPAEGVRRRCIKNFPSILSCIDKSTREGIGVSRVADWITNSEDLL